MTTYLRKPKSKAKAKSFGAASQLKSARGSPSPLSTPKSRKPKTKKKKAKSLHSAKAIKASSSRAKSPKPKPRPKSPKTKPSPKPKPSPAKSTSSRSSSKKTRPPKPKYKSRHRSSTASSKRSRTKQTVPLSHPKPRKRPPRNRIKTRKKQLKKDKQWRVEKNAPQKTVNVPMPPPRAKRERRAKSHKPNTLEFVPPEVAESVVSVLPRKFDISEMQWVVNQIALMKKSWRTPAEEVQRSIYKIINMQDRPHLNHQFVKVILILDDENYRIRLLANANQSNSEFILPKYNLELAFETENLYLLFSSMNSRKHTDDSTTQTANNIFKKKSKKKSSVDIGFAIETAAQQQNTSRDMLVVHQPPPPKENIDDMHTIAAFEHGFEETYIFKRIDYHVLGCCFVLALVVLIIGFSLFLAFAESDKKHRDDYYVFCVGVVVMIFGPLICLSCGLLMSCSWYCVAIWTGKMDFYLGHNKFFGYECRGLDCCKFQYFLLVSVIGFVLLIMSLVLFLIVVESVIDVARLDSSTKAVLQVVEVLSVIVSFCVFIGAVLVWYCFRTWGKRDAIWQDRK